MKKSLTRKLLLSVATLALALTSFVTTTVAWFTVNTVATANAVTFTGASSQDTSLLVSADGVTFKAEATPTLAGGTGTALKDVQCYYTNTKVGGADGNVPAFYNISLTASDKFTTAGGATYAKWSLWFQTPNDDTKTVKLKTLTLTSSTDPVAWQCRNTFGSLFTAGNNYYFNAFNAARFGIETFAARDWTGDTPVYETTDSTGFSRYFIHENTTAASHAITVVGDGGGLGVLNGEDALGYYNSILNKSLNPLDIAAAVPSVAGTVTSYADVDATTKVNPGTAPTNTTVTTTGTASQISKVDFYFWIEGWDRNCFDGLTTSAFAFSVGMTFGVEAVS